jgi:hypothetical protein
VLSHGVSMAFVLVRVATPFLRVLEIFGDSLCGGYPVTSDLPGAELAARGQEAQMTRTEPRQDRRLPEGDVAAFFQWRWRLTFSLFR